MTLDSRTCLDTSYIDFCIRFVRQCRMCKYHAAALPMVGSHTGLAQFNLISKLLDILFPHWKETPIGVSSDGARNMTGAVQGFVTRLQQASIRPGFIRVWFLLYQLEIKLEEACMALEGSTFMTTVLSMVSHYGVSNGSLTLRNLRTRR